MPLSVMLSRASRMITLPPAVCDVSAWTAASVGNWLWLRSSTSFAGSNPTIVFWPKLPGVEPDIVVAQVGHAAVEREIGGGPAAAEIVVAGTGIGKQAEVAPEYNKPRA